MTEHETQTADESLIDHTPRGQLWIARNFQRARLLSGVALVLTSAWGLAGGAYFGATVNGFAGLWLLGGWPAVRRLVRYPKMQLKHWYHVLIDARKVNRRRFEDGSVEVTEMRPTLSHGWGWRSLRWYERD